MKRSEGKQLSIFNFVQKKERLKFNNSNLITDQNLQENSAVPHAVNDCENNSNVWDFRRYI